MIAMIGGIFPDVDLFYYYFFSATFSHHEVFTHSFFIYLVFFVVIFFIGLILKNHFIKIAGFLFFSGVVTHLLADSIGAGIVWLYPFSQALFGLDNFAWYNLGFGYNYFAINYILEGTIFFILALIIIKQLINKQKIKLLLYALAVLGYAYGVIILLFMNSHLFHGKSDVYYSDYDHDETINKYDFDIDGDSIHNIDDWDIDQNGVFNKKQFEPILRETEEIWYDPTNAGLVEIPLRMGFVTNTNYVERCYANMGIFFRTEMEKDYKENPEGYLTGPENKNFEKTPQNWRAWLSHKHKLLQPIKGIIIGDILFFENDYVAIVLNENQVIEANKDQGKVVITPLNDLMNRKGHFLYIGRLIQN